MKHSQSPDSGVLIAITHIATCENVAEHRDEDASTVELPQDFLALV